MLSVVMPIVTIQFIMLIVILLSVVMLNFTIISIMLHVIMLCLTMKSSILIAIYRVSWCCKPLCWMSLNVITFKNVPV
jgi:hypothetical protein